MSSGEIGSKIDHTRLTLEANLVEVVREYKFCCNLGIRGFVSHPWVIARLNEAVDQCRTMLIGVVSFPYGMDDLKTKLRSIDHLFSSGAEEVDVVSNVNLLLNGFYEEYEAEVRELVSYVKGSWGKVVKLIVEVPMLNDRLLEIAIEAVNKAGPDYFKTSTGKGPRGTTVEDVVNIRRLLSPSIGIKASGGIRSCDAAKSLLDAGADIIGSSSGIAIVEECMGIDDEWREA